MSALRRALLGLTVLVLLAAAGLCVWLILYTGDLPTTGQLSDFAPGVGSLATDSCLAGLSFAVRFEDIGKPFRDALASAEPRLSFPDEIARTMMCNSSHRNARYQLDVFRLSWHIRRRFSEAELFTIFANRAYFGPAATGIDNAADHFFQKNALTLSTEEAALLAGVLRSPGSFSPFKHPDMALQRRNQILEAMAIRGQLNAAELAKAKASPVVTRSLGNTETNPLPPGVLKALAGDEAEYCDQFEDSFKKGCGETFQANLRWSEFRITPQGQPAILIENRNTSFCGSAGCALDLFIEQPDNRFAQILERDGEVGTLDRISVLKTTANGHYNIQKIWADSKTHTIYRWDGSRYSAD